MLTGSLVALVTPMHADGTLDFEAWHRLIDMHVAANTQGLVVVGTTGESATLSRTEHTALIRAAVTHAAGRIPIVAGAGANCTEAAIELAQAAKAAGAAATLSVVPAYNKPTQEGLYLHFRTIAERVDLPMYLYNVPSRTGADLENSTVLRLAEIPGIVGLKDATGDLSRAVDLIRRIPEPFALYSGDDATALPFMLLGGHGVISVTANLAPRAMRQLCDAARQADVSAARTINDALFDLHRVLFVEANPIPVKWALNQLGRIEGGIRLPLTPLDARWEALIRDALAHCKRWCAPS